MMTFHLSSRDLSIPTTSPLGFALRWEEANHLDLKSKQMPNNTLVNYTIENTLRSALQDIPGVPVGLDVSITDLVYTDDIALLRGNFEAVQDALQGADRCAHQDEYRL